MEKYDYLIVGGGLFSGTFAYLAKQAGKKCLILEKRDVLGGNIYCDTIEGIHVHKYGAHIFHTNNKKIWKFVNSLVEFNQFKNAPIANYRGEIYNLPFNMNTFSKMWGVVKPEEAKAIIESQKKEVNREPQNLEEQAISIVGKDIYVKLIKGYTEKQWGRECRDLPAFIIQRIPIRYTYDNNYFNDLYQGIPIGGYNELIQRLFEGCDVRFGMDYNDYRDEFANIAVKVLYTGTLDSYFNYRLGKLEYRSLKFETEILNQKNYQGVAVMNFTDEDTPYTRIIEHKHFEYGTQENTVITKEYPVEWKVGTEPYYPVNNVKNTKLFKKYWSLAMNEANVIFGGRLAEYKYYDMDKVIESAFNLAGLEFQK